MEGDGGREGGSFSVKRPSGGVTGGVGRCSSLLLGDESGDGVDRNGRCDNATKPFQTAATKKVARIVWDAGQAVYFASVLA